MEKLNQYSLMIGDWFRFRYTIDGKEIVHTFRISRIEDELGDYYVWGEGFGRMCYPKRLEPIPITPEILEKNGFTNVGEKVWQWEEKPFWVWWEEETHHLGIEIDDSSYDEEKSKTIMIIVQNYAHELQHALRLCGIDKTIVL